MANSSGGSGGKNPLAALGSAKAKGIIALVLVGVLLVASIVGSIASFIGMLVGSDEEESEGDLYTETRLYVRALQGKWDDSAKHAMQNGKKNVPIEQLKVQLKPKAAYKANGTKIKDERSMIDFDPTDSDGYSYITLDASGMGKLTMSTGNDAYYGISSASGGKPTKHYKVLARGRFTYYDSYTYAGASDTHGTSYNLNKHKKSSAHFSDGSPLDKQKNSPSDTWHIFGLMETPQPVQWDRSLYNTLKAKRKTDPALLYAWSPDGASYGAGIGIDTGYGSSSGLIADLFLPYNKYFGRYGLNPKHSKNDGGGHSPAGLNFSGTIDPYFKSLGANPNTRKVWDSKSKGNTLYYLDDSDDKVNGKKRSKYLHSLTLNDKAWPTTMTGGKVIQDSKTDDGDTNDLYTLACKLTDEGAQKYGSGGKFHNWFGEHTTDHHLSKIEECIRSDPYVVKCGNGATGEWTLLFWTETVTVGDDGDLGAGSTDYLSWMKKLADSPKVGYKLQANHGSSFHVGDVDCSSFVFWALKKCGYLPKETSCFSTSNEREVLERNGFKQVSLSNLKPGDILWKPGHTEVYVGGKAYSFGAHQRIDNKPGKGHGKGNPDSTAPTEVGYARGKQVFTRAYRFVGDKK